MNKKTLKIALNILVFILIAGFGYYMVRSITSEKNTIQPGDENAENVFVSPYKKTYSFDAASEILCFDIYENAVYVALSGKVSVFALSGKHQHDFVIKASPRDIVVDETTIYLLYPTGIELYAFDGQKTGEWEACSDNSDYCAFTTTKDYVFVTDAENKNIVQYDKQGGLVRFIKSPEGFVIPSYAFDIISISDTIYCANSGRHRIESYTPDGEFIASFGKSGAEAGAFTGCCNPVYLAKSSDGQILTSEKGDPRISCYARTGQFRTILFDGKMLEGGTAAYEMQVSGENIYIANRETISVFGEAVSKGDFARHCGLDPQSRIPTCGDCPVRKK